MLSETIGRALVSSFGMACPGAWVLGWAIAQAQPIPPHSVDECSADRTHWESCRGEDRPFTHFREPRAPTASDRAIDAFNTGITYFNNAQWAEAAKWFREALRWNNQYVRAYEALAKSLANQQQTESALAQVRIWRDLAPASADAAIWHGYLLVWYAEDYWNQRRPEDAEAFLLDAEKAFNDALSLDLNNGQRNYVLRQLARLRRNKAVLTRVVSQIFEYRAGYRQAQAANDLGIELLNSGDDKAALRAFEDAQAALPKVVPEALRSPGERHDPLNESIDQNVKVVHRRIASTKYTEGRDAYIAGDYDLALKIWGEALEHVPADPTILDVIAKANAKIEEQRKAKTAEEEQKRRDTAAARDRVNRATAELSLGPKSTEPDLSFSRSVAADASAARLSAARLEAVEERIGQLRKLVDRLYSNVDWAKEWDRTAEEMRTTAAKLSTVALETLTLELAEAFKHMTAQQLASAKDTMMREPWPDLPAERTRLQRLLSSADPQQANTIQKCIDALGRLTNARDRKDGAEAFARLRELILLDRELTSDLALRKPGRDRVSSDAGAGGVLPMSMKFAQLSLVFAKGIAADVALAGTATVNVAEAGALLKLVSDRERELTELRSRSYQRHELQQRFDQELATLEAERERLTYVLQRSGPTNLQFK